MIELRVLGPTALRRDDYKVDSFLAGPKRLGILTYLVLARPRGFRRRDKILALFWPELGQKAARNALSNMLYHIRRELGDDVLVNRGAEEVCIGPENLWCDAVAFGDHLDRGELEAGADLYRGELLEGFHVPGAAPEFDQWLDAERERLRTRAAEAAWMLAGRSEASGHAAAARSWAKKAAAWTPFSDESQRRLIAVFHRSGDRTGALQAYDDYAARLRREWDMMPSAALSALAEEIRGEPERSDRSVKGKASSLAVLPFIPMGEGEATTFTEGMHGDLLTRLSNISALRVISRTSVRRYRESDKSLPQIGSELGAHWIVEGEVQESDGHVRVSVRLVDAQADRQVWANRYRRVLTAATLFQIQEDVAKEIAHAVRAELNPEERKRLAETPTENLVAYRLYVQGRTHLDQRTEGGMRRALDYFRRALDHDSDYVLAWVGVADALSLLNDYGYASAEDVLSEAEEAIRRALSLDPESAEAHTSLGLLHSVRFDGPAAVRELNHAVELRSNYAEAHNWLSWVHLLLGNPHEALEHASRAVELNPLSPEAVSNLSLSYLVNGRRRKAVAEARRESELGSAWGTGRFYEALALYEMGRYAETVSTLRGVSAAWAGEGPRATLALAHAATGERDEAVRILHRIEEAGDDFAAGLVHAALGATEEAFEAFSRAEPLSDWPTLAVRHLYQNVWSRFRDDLRFEELRRRVDAAWGVAAPEVGSARLNPTGVAVLPFQELGGNDESAFFASGLHDDLLTKLSRVGTLTVISRASVTRFFAERSSIPEFARTLGVGTIVEGVVRLAGRRVRLNIQLIDARTEALRWAETYDRELTADNVFDLQNELAEKITAHLETRVTATERERVERRPTRDLEAFRLYAHGRQQLDLRSEEGMRAALGYFRRAVDQDPSYALAWAGEAEALSLLEFYEFEAPPDAPDAMKAALRAVSLNSDLGEAHAAQGIVHAVRHEGPAAARRLERAITLSPGYAEAHIWLGWVRLCLGLHAEAVEPSARALRLNPLAPAVRVYTAEICLANGDEQQALHHARRAREIQPSYGLAHFTEAMVLHHLHRYDEAAAALSCAQLHVHRRGTPTEAEVRTLLGITLMSGGKEEQARAELARIDPSQDPFPASLAAAALGDVESAFSLLHDALEKRALRPEYLRYYFPDILGSLRQDPRYEVFLRDLGRKRGALQR